MQVGFIGLGTMGARMAASLQRAGYRLIVHDVRPEAAEPHIAAGAVWADSPRQLAQDAQLVFTSLPTPGRCRAGCPGRERAASRHATRDGVFRSVDQRA